MKYKYQNITKIPSFDKYFYSYLVASSFGNNSTFAEHSSVLQHISPKLFMVPAVFCTCSVQHLP